MAEMYKLHSGTVMDNHILENERLEPENHLFEKENHLPNPKNVHFTGVFYIPSQIQPIDKGYTATSPKSQAA